MQSINKFRDGTFYVTGIAFICYIVSSIILKLFNLQYRAWVNVFCIAVVCVCLLLGLVLSYISFNSIKKKLLLLIAFLLSLGFIWICRLPIVIFCEAIPHKDRVDTIDGRTFVGYEDDFWDRSIDYYEYKNFLVAGSKRFFSLYTVDENPDGSLAYYDMDGNRIYHLSDLHEYRYVDELKK